MARLITFSLWRILCILTLTTHASSRVNKDTLPSCDEFSVVVMNLYRDYITPQFEADYDLHQMMPYFLGVNWQDPVDVHRFACKLTGVYNLKSLSKLIHMPYGLLRDHYNTEVAAIDRQGGTPGLSYQLSLREFLLPAARRVGLPDLPVRASQSQVRGCLRLIVARYGKDFINRYMVNWPLDNPLLVNDVDKFSKLLVAADSADDFAFRMNLNEDDVHNVAYTLAYDIEEWPNVAQGFRSYVAFVKMADDLGLLNLPP